MKTRTLIVFGAVICLATILFGMMRFANLPQATNGSEPGDSAAKDDAAAKDNAVADGDTVANGGNAVADDGDSVAGEDDSLSKELVALASPHHRRSQFPDFGFMVSNQEYVASYSDHPLFRIKTDFPKKMPPASEMPAFIKQKDFTKEPLEYLKAVQAYSFEGNLPDWNPHTNKVRPWYHIPWLHPNSTTGYPPNGGTEGFHGLIKEAPVSAYQLAGTQIGSYQVYAVTLVNSFAGYTLGQMWKDPDMPDPRATDRRFGGGFPHGTVFAKLLFTDAPQGDDIVPFLDNPLTWKAYITENWNSPQRAVTDMHLLQMDVLVRDPRYEDDPGFTGWVFGTFVYNGAVNNPNKFLNLVPLGVMWGNDPDKTDNNVTPYPPKPLGDIINKDLEQTVIFDLEQSPPQHLGWNSRLNGPADLNTSSCLSCHATAQYPAVTSLVPPGSVPAGGPLPPPGGGNETWMQWFQNYKCATSMDPRTYSCDFSLQVVISLQNFFAVKSADLQGHWATEYEFGANPIARDGTGN